MRFQRHRFSDGEMAIVMAFDVCSSSEVIELLNQRGSLSKYQHLLGKIKHYLADQQTKLVFDPYKFTGDGWILLFREKDLNGAHLLAFMSGLSKLFISEFEKISRILDICPEITGINFGIDKGRVFHAVMFQTHEYIGCPINIACRLQGAIKDGDKAPAYKALVSNSVFYDHLEPATGYKCESTTRKLRNIHKDESVKCMHITL